MNTPSPETAPRNEAPASLPSGPLFDGHSALAVDEMVDFGEHWDEMVEMLVPAGLVTVSKLQRHFGIGYNKAQRMVWALERRGLVSSNAKDEPDGQSL